MLSRGCSAFVYRVKASSFDQEVLWGLFQNTLDSLLQITNPWDGYLEAGLVHRKLEECGEAGRTVDRASRVIGEANKASEAVHREILYALFCGSLR